MGACHSSELYTTVCPIIIKTLNILFLTGFYSGLFETSIPLVLMENSTARDEVGVLLMADELLKLRSGCAFALVQGGKESMDLVTEAIQRFHVTAVFSLKSGGHQKLDPQLMPIGPYHVLDNVIFA